MSYKGVLQIALVGIGVLGLLQSGLYFVLTSGFRECPCPPITPEQVRANWIFLGMLLASLGAIWGAFALDKVSGQKNDNSVSQ